MIKNRDIIEKIKDRLDIVEVIGKDVSLRRESGTVYTGAVSSSSKSGSSLKVDSSLQLYKDFAGGSGGDVFAWIGLQHNLDTHGAGFSEVLQIAAEMAGVELTQMTDEERAKLKEKADIHDIFTQAAEIYHKNLTEEHYKYILEKWGITKETVDKLKIGYANNGRNLKELVGDTLNKSGLTYNNDGKPGSEVFQGRIIFPYWKNGKVVYLIGRQTDKTPKRKEGGEPPKYQKILVYKPGREYVSESVANEYFYGEDSLRGADHCIITEGVADCIAVLQAGLPCISPVTVQFREEDHKKLISLTKNLHRVYICNDNELNNVGLKGSVATAMELEKNGIEAWLVQLPRPDDLDKIDIAEYMKTHTADDFRQLMDKGMRVWEFKLNMVSIPAHYTSLARLKAFTLFIREDLNGMDLDEWEVFVNNDVAQKFNLTKKDVHNIIDKILKEKKATVLPADETVTAADETENNLLADYPQWAIDEANRILNAGEAFEFIHATWQKRHVGDKNLGENCICSVITRQILNSHRGLHIKPSGESGKGKSDAIENFLELLPPGTAITGSMSSKSLFYDPNLRPGTIVYCDDAEFTNDVIATIKQCTSKFQSPTTHRTIVDGEFRAFTAPERLTFWFSTVGGIEDEQLANRFLHADVDASPEQDWRVLQHQKDVECEIETDEIPLDILICRCIYSILYSQTYRVVIPFANAINWNNEENRRNFDKFKDIVRAVAVYNIRNREIFENRVLADVEDFHSAMKIYRGTSVSNATNLTQTEMKVLRFIVSAPKQTTTQKEIMKALNLSESTTRRILNGKRGNGGLLEKVKQLSVIDRTDTKRDGDNGVSIREKQYVYTGELTNIDSYASAGSIDEDKLIPVIDTFKSMLRENSSDRSSRSHTGHANLTGMNQAQNSISIINIDNNNTIPVIKNKRVDVRGSLSLSDGMYGDEEKESNNNISTFSEKFDRSCIETVQQIPENRKNDRDRYMTGIVKTREEEQANVTGDNSRHETEDNHEQVNAVTPVISQATGQTTSQEEVIQAMKKVMKNKYNGVIPSIDTFVLDFATHNTKHYAGRGIEGLTAIVGKLIERGDVTCLRKKEQ